MVKCKNKQKSHSYKKRTKNTHLYKNTRNMILFSPGTAEVLKFLRWVQAVIEAHLQRVGCDRFLGRTHAPRTSRCKCARTSVRTFNIGWSHFTLCTSTLTFCKLTFFQQFFSIFQGGTHRRPEIKILFKKSLADFQQKREIMKKTKILWVLVNFLVFYRFSCFLSRIHNFS